MSSSRDFATTPKASAPGETLCLLEAAERLFGPEIADMLWRELAGLRFYVPKQPSPDSRLARAIGHEKAMMIGADLGGLHVYVPGTTSLRQRRIIKLRVAGRTAQEIAVAVCCTERSVFRTLEKARAAGLIPPELAKGGRR